MDWYAIQTHRHRERLAAMSLAQRRIDSYLPRIVQWPAPAVGSAIAPLFPGYLFVRAAADDFVRITFTPGVRTFVHFGLGPASIDASVIDFLREREGEDGLIRCGEPTTQTVRIVHGPFRGLTALLERRIPAQERVRVLMHMLRSETAVELPERWVRLA